MDIALHFWDVLNVMNMDTIGKAAEDIWYVEGAAKETQTTWRKIVPMKPNAQTAKKIALYFQVLVTYTKTRGN